MYTTSILLALAAAQGALAGGRGGNWAGAKPFSCPNNTPTTCSSDQSTGFGSNGWSGAQSGQSISTFGGCGFSGVTCQDKGPSGQSIHKRDSDRCFSGCISGEADACPKMSAGKGSGSGSTFSPDTYHVSCSYDTQVDFIYSKSDGTTCKHTSPCSAAGNDVQNTQCGGYETVTCQQSQDEKNKNNGKTCNMGWHSIGFHCGSATSVSVPTPPATKPATENTHPATVQSHPGTTDVHTKPGTTDVQSKPATSTPENSKPATTDVNSKPASSTPVNSKPATTDVNSKPATSTPENSKPASSTPVNSKPATTDVNSKPATSTPENSKPASSTAVASSKPTTPPFQTGNNQTVPASTPATTPATSSFATTTFMTTSTAFVTTEITVTSCAPEITNCPAESRTPMVITSTISQYTTICPVTATMMKSGTSMVPVVSETKPASSAAASSVPAGSAPASSAPASSAAASSAAPPSGSSVPVSCPDVVPSCVSTLLESIQTDCKSNTDSSCFCAAANHTSFIQECIAAHGSDANEINEALSYLQGLCAPQIPQNPSIVTNNPGGSPQQPVVPSGVPATTITVSYTKTVPCSETNAPATSAAATSISASMTAIPTQTVITVPQVQITTATPAPGASGTPTVGLAGGCPDETKPASPASSTPAAAATTPAQAAKTTAAAPPVGPKYTASAVASTGMIVPTASHMSPPIQQTGAASKVGVSFGAVVAAAAFLL